MNHAERDHGPLHPGRRDLNVATATIGVVATLSASSAAARLLLDSKET